VRGATSSRRSRTSLLVGTAVLVVVGTAAGSAPRPAEPDAGVVALRAALDVTATDAVVGQAAGDLADEEYLRQMEVASRSAARTEAEELRRRAAQEAARVAEEQRLADEEAARVAEEQRLAAERAAVVAAAVADPRSVGRALAAERGWGGEQFGCLDRLWTKESGWKHTADNPTSSAYGIPQALPGKKMASEGADWESNPITQIRWGLGYIDDVYGTPCSAWGHSQRVDWY